MDILIIEDDPVQYKYINETLEQTDFTNLKVDRIESESKFRNRFEEIARNKPEIIIMDVMIRWADPSRNMERPPPEILEEGFYRAGIRCIKMLNDDERTKKIPIIIYSILDDDTIKDDISKFSQAKYLYKDFEARNLVREIKSRIR